MPKGSAATLFVSSTCYDLAQLRADIRDFSNSIGVESILSEFDSFPVNPSKNTVQNCLDAVRNKADIFLLVVGGRYGSISETGVSVTNLEYIEATSRGIPRYVFIKNEILAILPIWKANPSADFSNTVDTPKLFEFVSGLRDKGEVWVFPFSTAQDIVSILRKQLSYLLADSLALRAKLQDKEADMLALTPAALRIYVEKPEGWEFLVFAKMLQENIVSHYKRRLDLELGIAYGQLVVLANIYEIINWVRPKLDQFKCILNGLTQTLNGDIRKAVGEPGQPGDIKRIEHIATRIADGYLHAIEWAVDFSRVEVGAEFQQIIKLSSQLMDNVLKEIEQFSASLFDNVSYALANSVDGDVVAFTLQLTTPDTKPLLDEIERLS